MMKQIWAILAMGFLSACSLQAIEAGANTNEVTITSEVITPEATSLQMICEQKGYTWQADESCTYSQEGSENQAEIKIFYPIELLQSSLMETTIDQYIAAYRADFDEQFAQFYDPEIAPWFMEISYEIYHHSPTILSIRFDESTYQGGAHPSLTFSSFTFDTAANQVLGFADLFADGVDPMSLAPMLREKIAANLGEYALMEQINYGTDELIDFANFALTDTDLLFFFEPSQVAAYAAGQQFVEIPLSDLVGILRDF